MTATHQLRQRALRAHRPTRPSDRHAVSGSHLADLASRLTPRDLWLARMLHEHRVLTSTQITQLAFGVGRKANLRLRALYEWRVVDRFQPHLPAGTAPMHYVVDTAGAAILCHHTGLDPARLGYRHDHAVGIAHSLRLAHTAGVNGVFTSLVAEARSRPGCALTAWWSEARCARLYGDLVRPDGYGRWREADREVEFFLEYDTGTEPLTRVAAKLDDYHHLAAETGIVTPVLFWFPTASRETHARKTLAVAHRRLARPASVPTATTHHAHDEPVAVRLWSPPAVGVGTADVRRVRLARLPLLQQPHTPAPRGDTTAQTPDAHVDGGGLEPPHPMPPRHGTGAGWTRS